MENYNVGDTIEHVDLPPGMWKGKVLDTRDCETDWNRSEPHLAYKIVDFVGDEDWVCAYDVRRVATAST